VCRLRIVIIAGALAVAGCGSSPSTSSDYSRICSDQGLTQGTDEFVDCVEQQKLRQQSEQQQIRQIRESVRGSSKL